MHELDRAQEDRTIYACGAFGIGSTRADDEVALRRMFEHLEPGGSILLD